MKSFAENRPFIQNEFEQAKFDSDTGMSAEAPAAAETAAIPKGYVPGNASAPATKNASAKQSSAARTRLAAAVPNIVRKDGFAGTSARVTLVFSFICTSIKICTKLRLPKSFDRPFSKGRRVQRQLSLEERSSSERTFGSPLAAVRWSLVNESPGETLWTSKKFLFLLLFLL